MGAQDGSRIAVIIEDDADIRNLLGVVLTQAGFEVVATANGADGVDAVREHDPIVTTLDVSMPGMDGFETAKRIRAFSSTYIVMLTARDEEIDTLQGLESGADDYITKPFRPRELRARIEAMLRRPRHPADAPETAPPAPSTEAATAPVTTVAPSPPGPTEGWIEHNGLRLQPEMRLANLRDSALDLTRTEFDLLAAILESTGRVRSKSDLALLLRGDDYSDTYYVGEADKRAVEVHMSNLRRKLGDSTTQPRWLETVRGVGYRLAAEDRT
ncbi:response regulator transcription factor [Glaciibacter sp. 2TAF33]|uniref:response regulator transcription factor n=1 Tax=Glaciibacter sp. 2TAF33 TaxID=3233015 RepID=UPI003F935347